VTPDTKSCYLAFLDCLPEAWVVDFDCHHPAPFTNTLPAAGEVHRGNVGFNDICLGGFRVLFADPLRRLHELMTGLGDLGFT